MSSALAVGSTRFRRERRFVIDDGDNRSRCFYLFGGSFKRD